MFSADEKFMALALKAAKRGQYKTWPNPSVGAVVVKKGKVIATGTTRSAGKEHAEVVALKKAKSAAKGATMYVTLEPCNHQGQTPPCAPALFQAGIRRVVAATRDTNPQAGGGLAWLKRKGVAVSVGPLQKEAYELNRHFFFALKHHRPWVTLKAAMSLDGRAAFTDGRSKWITSPQARDDARKLRGDCDAVAVGGATVARDNPTLLPLRAGKNVPARFVLDWKSRVSGKEKIFHDEQASATYWITSDPSSAKLRRVLKDGANLVLMRPKANLAASVAAFLRFAGEMQLRRLWLEGGPKLLGAFAGAGFGEELYLYQAPQLWGNGDTRPVFEGARSADPEGLVTLKNWSVRKIGRDLRWHGTL